MLKRSLAFGLWIVVLNLFFSTSAFAQSTQDKDAKFTAKVKANIQKLGQGKDVRVQVKLKNGTKLKGHIDQINQDSFVVINDATGTATEVPYSETKQVKGSNRYGVWTVIGVGTLTAMIAILIVAGNSD